MEILNLNRLNDALFKAVFGENPEITLDFINSVFKYEGTPTFQTIDFIDRELDPVEEYGKESRLDLVGREIATGAKVNLEIQVVKEILIKSKNHKISKKSIPKGLKLWYNRYKNKHGIKKDKLCK